MASRSYARVPVTTDAPSLRRLMRQWLAATAVVVLSAFLVIDDLAGANRPHELHNAPWVAGITLLNLLFCAGVLAKLKGDADRRRQLAELGWGYHGLVFGLIVAAVLNLAMFVAAAGSVPAVLAG